MPRAKILIATSLAALTCGAWAQQASAASSECDRLTLPTVSANGTWRIVQAPITRRSVAVLLACDRHAPGPLQVRRLVPSDETARAGVRSWQALGATLRGDRALLRGWTAESRARTRLVDLRTGGVMAPLIPDSWKFLQNFQRTEVVLTGAGSLAWTSYGGAKQVAGMSSKVETLDADGRHTLPLDALLVTAPETGDSLYVRYPDVSVRRLTPNGPVSADRLPPDRALRWRAWDGALRPTVAWPRSRELASPTDRTSFRIAVVERADGRAAIRATYNGSPMESWDLARGSARAVRVLAMRGETLVVKARFADAPTVERVRAIYRYPAPGGDFLADRVTPGRSVAVVPRENEWAISTLDGIIEKVNGKIVNVGHPGATDLAYIDNQGWALYVNDPVTGPTRIPPVAR